MTSTTKFAKGDDAFYSNRVGTYRARVKTVHRDGSVTVVAQFAVDADGKDKPYGFLGYTYRMDAADLRASV